LGIGDWGLGPIPNPQSPIPKKAHLNIYSLNNNYYLKHLKLIFNLYKYFMLN